MLLVTKNVLPSTGKIHSPAHPDIQKSHSFMALGSIEHYDWIQLLLLLEPKYKKGNLMCNIPPPPPPSLMVEQS